MHSLLKLVVGILLTLKKQIFGHFTYYWTILLSLLNNIIIIVIVIQIWYV